MYAATYTREPSQPSGGPLPGTVRLQRRLVDEFQGQDLGIYNPRDVCGNLWPKWKCVGSQHARGAAGDVGFPILRPNGHPTGHRLANHLVANHRQLGVQEVIWAGRRWSNQTSAWSSYDGRSDHFDHVHYALTSDASVNLTDAEIDATFHQPQQPKQPEFELPIYAITDQPGKFFQMMPDGLVRITPEEAYTLGLQGVPSVKITDALFRKLHSGPRAVSFNDAPKGE